MEPLDHGLHPWLKEAHPGPDADEDIDRREEDLLDERMEHGPRH